jgi:hypothetical protein
MGTASDGEVDAKCNTMSTEGEKEKSWRHKEHDKSIITRAFKFSLSPKGVPNGQFSLQLAQHYM